VIGFTRSVKSSAATAASYDRFPYVVLGWLLLSVIVVIAAPRFARRLGEGLARREGLEESIACGPA